LLFHDTHHRSVTDPKSMEAYDLTHYDGILAFGEVVRDLYLTRGWASRAWTWHEAADTRVFYPIEGLEHQGDLVWIGNWGDEERTAELWEFVFNPVKALVLTACVYGVRYPAWARAALAAAGITYTGWLPNYEVPGVFARFRVTVHVPRRPYVQALPGIPTIRPFEALACGIPLICSPWDDAEGLFTPGKDFLVARNGAAMKRLLKALLEDEAMAHELAGHGLQTLLTRHTCAHRVDELLAIYAELEANRPAREEAKCAAD
jgi:spore maturation protein CgeB